MCRTADAKRRMSANLFPLGSVLITEAWTPSPMTACLDAGLFFLLLWVAPPLAKGECVSTGRLMFDRESLFPVSIFNHRALLRLRRPMAMINPAHVGS